MLAKGKYHWFVTSCLNWYTSDSLVEALEMLKTRDKNSGYTVMYYRVWYVPVPIETKYKIDEFMPLVEGSKLICKEEYKW